MSVHFVGAGPGAADLLTLRGARVLAEADVCLYAGTYIAAVLAHCRPEARLIDTQYLNLDEICAQIIDAHRAGLRVARLCSGDPSIYSALAEQARRLATAGVDFEVVPGVPAYAAATALLGKELTVPEVAQTVVLTRAQRDSTAMPESESLSYLAKSRATLVLHLAIRHTRRLTSELVDSYGANCPAIVVANATQPEQLILRSTLTDIADQVEDAGLTQAAVILVGWVFAARGFVDSHLYASRHLDD